MVIIVKPKPKTKKQLLAEQRRRDKACTDIVLYSDMNLIHYVVLGNATNCCATGRKTKRRWRKRQAKETG